MTGFLLPRDIPLWRAARPWLDVRSNDVHTLISYRLGQALLRLDPKADESVVLPAIVLHDIGWKMFPPEKLAAAVGPNPKYPELQRDHEIESVRIGGEILARLNVPGLDGARILEIIDGHDTRKVAISREDAIMKDADKLWRFTAHGVSTIGGWFNSPASETLPMLESFVLPTLLTDAGRAMAEALLAEAVAIDQADTFLALKDIQS